MTTLSIDVKRAIAVTTAEQELKIQLRPAWRLGDLVIAQDAQAFWKRLNLLPPREIDRRTSELCAAAYHDDTLVSVSTAIALPFESLKARLAMFRCAVDPLYPREFVATRMAIFSHEQLERWSHENPVENVSGMLLPIPNQVMRERQYEPVWRVGGLEFHLVGRPPTGEQLRVAWFSRGPVN